LSIVLAFATLPGSSVVDRARRQDHRDLLVLGGGYFAAARSSWSPGRGDDATPRDHGDRDGALVRKLKKVIAA
jgi:hypothetical protein